MSDYNFNSASLNKSVIGSNAIDYLQNQSNKVDEHKHVDFAKALSILQGESGQQNTLSFNSIDSIATNGNNDRFNQDFYSSAFNEDGTSNVIDDEVEVEVITDDKQSFEQKMAVLNQKTSVSDFSVLEKEQSDFSLLDKIGDGLMIAAKLGSSLVAPKIFSI